LKGSFEKYSKTSCIPICTLKTAFYKEFPANEHSRKSPVQNVDILNEDWKREYIKEYFVFNDTGYLNTNTFEMVSNKVASFWNEVHPGVDLFLLGDGCSAHTSNANLLLNAFSEEAHNFLTSQYYTFYTTTRHQSFWVF